MYVKQLSVFIENRKGRLAQVAGVLEREGINIVSLSLADTNEYGLLRMIVSDPEKAKKVLREDGFSAMLTDILAVRLENRTGELQKVLNILNDEGMNVEYMYLLDSTKENGSMVFKVDNVARAGDAVRAAGMQVFGAEEAYAIHV